jgi:hypothetical protein
MSGLANFFRLYRPMATTWKLCDNSEAPLTKLVAAGESNLVRLVADQPAWEQIHARYNR